MAPFSPLPIDLSGATSVIRFGSWWSSGNVVERLTRTMSVTSDAAMIHCDTRHHTSVASVELVALLGVLCAAPDLLARTDCKGALGALSRFSHGTAVFAE